MTEQASNVNKKKKIAIISVSGLILVAMVVAVAVGVTQSRNKSKGSGGSGNNGAEVSASMKAVKAICETTQYKETCVDKLSSAAGNTSDPKEIMKIGFQASIDELNNILKNGSLFKELEKDPSTAEALEICKQQMDYAIDDLRTSFEEMGEFDVNRLNEYIDSLKTWLSGAVTFQDTCLDSFDGTTGNAGEVMKQVLKIAMELTSNGLDMASEITSILGLPPPTAEAGASRRLLSEEDENDGIPSWVNADQRRLLRGDKGKGNGNHGKGKGNGNNGNGNNGNGNHGKGKGKGKGKPIAEEGGVAEAQPEAEAGAAPAKPAAAAPAKPAAVAGPAKPAAGGNFLAGFKPQIVVAKDGSGQYTTIKDALKHFPKKTNKNDNSTVVIYIKAGVYDEQVQVDKTMTHVIMIGDGPTRTRITGKKNFGIQKIKTLNTATFSVVGNNFMAKDIGFENTAGPAGQQAVALHVQSDQSIFYNCHMDGYQDTLYTHTHRQFYRDCKISGTVDFIFGNAAAVLQNCRMEVRRPGEKQTSCMVTAQGREKENMPTGYVLQNCTITGAKDFYAVKDRVKAYLGRPWKDYSRTVVMESQIDDIIVPAGWAEWENSQAHKKCSYMEYKNRGSGSNPGGRVKWPGVKTSLPPQQAARFTSAAFIAGDSWVKRAGVPYVSGMMNL